MSPELRIQFQAQKDSLELLYAVTDRDWERRVAMATEQPYESFLKLYADLRVTFCDDPYNLTRPWM